jgi:hypothetical protein
MGCAICLQLMSIDTCTQRKVSAPTDVLAGDRPPRFSAESIKLLMWQHSLGPCSVCLYADSMHDIIPWVLLPSVSADSMRGSSLWVLALPVYADSCLSMPRGSILGSLVCICSMCSMASLPKNAAARCTDAKTEALNWFCLLLILPALPSFWRCHHPDSQCPQAPCEAQAHHVITLDLTAKCYTQPMILQKERGADEPLTRTLRMKLEQVRIYLA